MTRKQITRLVTTWQEKLGLQSWDITVRFKPLTEKKYKDCLGYVSPDATYKVAYLTFNTLRLKEVGEYVVVHELLHCALHSIFKIAAEGRKNTEVIDFLQETIAVDLGRAIVKLAK